MRTYVQNTLLFTLALFGASAAFSQQPYPNRQFQRTIETWRLFDIPRQPATSTASQSGRSTISVYELQNQIPRKVRKPYSKGRTLLEKHRPKDAIPYLRRVTESAPDYLLGHNDLAVAYLENDQPELAIQQVQQALLINPDYSPLYSILAVAYLEQREFSSAESTARRLVGFRDNQRARFILGIALLFQDKFTTETFALLEHSEANFPAAGLLLARYYAGRGNFSAARAKLHTYLASGFPFGREIGEDWLRILNKAHPSRPE